MSESKAGNPLFQEMLDELCEERPEIWSLVEQWLAQPLCLHLIHFLDSMPTRAITLSDLSAQFECEPEELQAALGCLLEQRIVTRQEIQEVGMTLYRLNDREPEQAMMEWFRAWCRRWRQRVRNAEEVLGVGWHWEDKRRGGS